jgi:hypothetical protein
MEVTLTIGGDSGGARAAIQETILAVQQLGQAAPGGAGTITGPYGSFDLGGAGPAAGAGLATAGVAARKAGDDFSFGRAEAGRFTQTLLQLGVLPPQLQRSFAYLLTAGLNPAFAGFAAGIIIVQGVIAALQRLEEQQARAAQGALKAADAYDKAGAALHGYIRSRERLTAPAEAYARHEELMLQAAGVPPEEAVKLMEATAAGRGALSDRERLELAEEWVGAGPEVPPKVRDDWKRFAAWSRRRPAAEREARRAAGRQAVAEVPSLRRRRERALGAAWREMDVPQEARRAQEIGERYDLSQEAVQYIMRGRGEWPARLGWLGDLLQEYAPQAPPRFGVGPYRPVPVRIERVYHGGHHTTQNFANPDAPNPHTGGQPRIKE